MSKVANMSRLDLSYRDDAQRMRTREGVELSGESAAKASSSPRSPIVSLR